VTVKRTISHLVLCIRPPLVTYRNNKQADRYCHDIMTGMSLLLHALTVKFDVGTVIHISSIAAVDHIQRQHLRSVREKDPSYTDLKQPYDRFKRGCEELVELVCKQQQQQSNRKNIRFTSVRVGAIFSDTPSCIQCSAFALQLYTGPYLNVPIDCNSGRNVASLIHLMLHSVKSELRPVYYYTRCITLYPKPVPYGEFLLAYRAAYGLQRLPMLLPAFLVEWCVVRPLHWFTVILTTLLGLVCLPAPPFLESIDYLLQVTLDEHTFEMRETVRDFPMIRQAEESMECCFRRRKAQLEADAAKRKNKAK